MSKLRGLWQREVNKHAQRYVRRMDVHGAGEVAALETIAAGADIEAVAEALGRGSGPTVTLVDPALASHFEAGRDVLSMPEADARAILGNAVYEGLIEAKQRSVPLGTVTVTAIRGTHGVIVVSSGPSGGGEP